MYRYIIISPLILHHLAVQKIVLEGGGVEHPRFSFATPTRVYRFSFAFHFLRNSLKKKKKNRLNSSSSSSRTHAREYNVFLYTTQVNNIHTSTG